MSTPQETRRTRLKNDFFEMENIRGQIVDWEIIRGNSPYVEEYRLTVNVRSIIDSKPTFRNSHVINISIPSTYPSAPPLLIMETLPQPFHPNWFKDGRWCGGEWVISEGLGHHVVRMIRTLQFDSEITSAGSPANHCACEWYEKQQNKKYFPCDLQILPDPTKKRFIPQKKSSRAFIIENNE
jgi:ubiquitin-protein ligase